MRRQFFVPAETCAGSAAEARRTVLRDLHDGVGPSLAAVALGLRSARQLLTSDPAGAARLLALLEDEMHSAIDDIKSLVASENPSSVTRLGLVGAVERFVCALRSRLHIRIDAAATFWVPPVVDAYSIRNDPAKRREIREKPRNQRHTVFGDPAPGYEWRLSPAGRADPFEAIMRLFDPQPAHRRSLVHCDYLVSLVHFRSMMEATGRAAFNARVAAHGLDRIILRWNLFAELEPPAPGRPGMGSIRQVVPASPADLVIGDHVYFWNHAAYDVINKHVGNAWRLENAVLVEKRGGTDVFLGHGSGRKTAAQMRAKLAEEYNDVALRALRLTRRARAGSAAARTELSTKFGVTEVGGEWRIRGTGLQNVAVDERLRLLRASDIPGLFAPSTPGVMYPVRRPAESA